jgi:Transposase DDE domain group 1
LTAADLIAWTQTILLDGALAKAGPKLLRYRLLHTAARIIRRDRRTFVKIAADWPWADQLFVAFTRLAGIRQPLLA